MAIFSVLPLIVVSLFAVLSTSHAHATGLIVVTDSLHPIQAPAGARVIMLDAPARIEAELDVGLSGGASRSAAIVRRRLGEGGEALQYRIAKAYQDVVDAWSLGITAIPAVVVDQRYVIYGEANVTQAIARIEAHRQGLTQ
ncbi:integrating conjugative element protein, PFL_4709 family [Halopseudomonas litoralis]|uniref:Integrating conjugative element protein, PFL_4709 family n=1 Tax=Halopseudomonas litoralis TaxID=797277 RepID=A0A1H1QAX9_9GAMM|nr:TIGR03757 family integrating conjugative element protein [Halopseudomonas litoralis]SDS20447.1 integrating conjugative element protein, PFL_4709 family [Halopseudomonas litoralis]